ncbi:MAG: hypothetical protein HOW73_46000 [Polyangiaceae bacterium]|nr:hypothetical protein [Polyangiaceae bacterium]
MSSTRWPTRRHLRTLTWIGAGSVFFAVVAGASYVFWPASPPPADSAARIVAVAVHLKWPAAIALLMVMSLFRIFYDEATLDPLAGRESPRHRINQRVLSNTVEHLVFFIPAVAALAAGADTPATWRLVPMAIALFCIGRLLFWAGYHVSPNARAFGFNLSFSTSAITVILAFAIG